MHVIQTYYILTYKLTILKTEYLLFIIYFKINIYIINGFIQTYNFIISRYDIHILYTYQIPQINKCILLQNKISLNCL